MIVDYTTEARQQAAQCWCDPETSDRVMDVELCEAIAKRINSWMQTAAMFAGSVQFYRDLLMECAKELQDTDVFTADDGSISNDPLALKVPECIRKLRSKYLEQQT